MKKNKTRRLWLEVRWKVPPGTPRYVVAQKLLHSIQTGTYHYPRSWKVAIGWRNTARSLMKWGEFRQEMRASKRSSIGFDIAVESYLENQL